MLLPNLVWAEGFYPLAGLDAQLLPKNKWELRVGTKYTQNRWFPFEGHNTHRKELWLPYLGLNIGVAENVELDMEYPYIYLDSERIHSKWDSGDLSVRVKLNILHSPDKSTFFTLNLETKLPNGDYNNRFSTNEADFFAEGLLSKSWGKVKIFLNGGMGIIGKPNSCNSQDDILTFAGGLRYSFSPGFNLLWEISGWAISAYNNNYTTMTVGGQYLLDPHWRLDAGIHVGLNDESEDWGVSAGISYIFEFPF